MPGATLLAPLLAPSVAPVAAPAASTSTSRAQNGPARAREGDDGATSFAGALAEAAGTRDEAAASGDRPESAERKSAADPATDDAEASSAVPARNDTLPVANVPWSEWLGALQPATPDASTEAASLAEASRLTTGRAARGLPGETAAAAELVAAARDALAADAATEAKMPQGGALPAGVARPAPDPRGAAAAGAAVPLPAELDTSRIEARRASRSPVGRSDTTEALSAAAGKAAPPDVGTAPARSLPSIAEPAAVGQARVLQDAVLQGEGRGAAVGHLVDDRAPVVGETSPGAYATAGVAASNTPSALARAADAPASFEARLDAALNSPEFVPSLGAQVSTLVRNGIPEARLHLHPAELGPITVQIEIDGQRAQVNMAVEHAATRQVLEQAIPTLASALRDNGLTLTGGGVFQQPREPQGQPGDEGRGSGRRGLPRDEGDVTAAVESALPRARVQRGALDLYA